MVRDIGSLRLLSLSTSNAKPWLTVVSVTDFYQHTPFAAPQLEIRDVSFGLAPHFFHDGSFRLCR